MRAALAAHDDVLRAAVERPWRLVVQAHRRRGLRGVRDGPRPPSTRRCRPSGSWRCRCGWAWRPARPQERDGDYFGPALNRAARVMAAGHGGQILLAASTASLVSGVDLVDLGEHRLRDLSGVEHLFQVRADGSGLDVRAVADTGRGAGEPAGAADQLRRPRGRGEGADRAGAGAPAGDAHRRRRRRQDPPRGPGRRRAGGGVPRRRLAGRAGPRRRPRGRARRGGHRAGHHRARPTAA